jgi:hypothetical protein
VASSRKFLAVFGTWSSNNWKIIRPLKSGQTIKILQVEPLDAGEQGSRRLVGNSDVEIYVCHDVVGWEMWLKMVVRKKQSENWSFLPNSPFEGCRRSSDLDLIDHHIISRETSVIMQNYIIHLVRNGATSQLVPAIILLEHRRDTICRAHDSAKRLSH